MRGHGGGDGNLTRPSSTHARYRRQHRVHHTSDVDISYRVGGPFQVVHGVNAWNRFGHSCVGNHEIKGMGSIQLVDPVFYLLAIRHIRDPVHGCRQERCFEYRSIRASAEGALFKTAHWKLLPSPIQHTVVVAVSDICRIQK